MVARSAAGSRLHNACSSSGGVMRNLLLLAHLAAAILWMGGMGFLLLALRAPLTQQLQPPARLQLAGAVMQRFLVIAAASVSVLLASGGYLLMAAPRGAPPGWHAMAGIGLLMALIFGHLYFGPWRRMKASLAASDWPEAGRRMGQLTTLARINFLLGWLAIAAVLLWR
jgi:uncharacterized membrane protein